MKKLQQVINNFANILLDYYNDQMSRFRYKAGPQMVLDNYLLKKEQIKDIFKKNKAISSVLPESHSLKACANPGDLLLQCINHICEGLTFNNSLHSYADRKQDLEALRAAYCYFSMRLEQIQEETESNWDEFSRELKDVLTPFQDLQSGNEEQCVVVNSVQFSGLGTYRRYMGTLSNLGNKVENYIKKDATFFESVIEPAIEQAQNHQLRRRNAELEKFITQCNEKFLQQEQQISAQKESIEELKRLLLSNIEATQKQLSEEIALSEQRSKAFATQAVTQLELPQSLLNLAEKISSLEQTLAKPQDLIPASLINEITSLGTRVSTLASRLDKPQDLIPKSLFVTIDTLSATVSNLEKTLQNPQDLIPASLQEEMNALKAQLETLEQTVEQVQKQKPVAPGFSAFGIFRPGLGLGLGHMTQPQKTPAHIERDDNQSSTTLSYGSDSEAVN